MAITASPLLPSGALEPHDKERISSPAPSQQASKSTPQLPTTNSTPDTNGTSNSVLPTSILHRSLHSSPLTVTSATGNHLHLTNGTSILDATGGAAVACLGHAHPRISHAIATQLSSFAYIHGGTFTSPIAESLAAYLVSSTHGAASKALLVSSGSEAMEAALKLVRQYWVERGQGATRTRVVSRWGSYHGNTLGALGVSGHAARRKPYAPMLAGWWSGVSPCYAYRGMKEGETEEGYAERLAGELEAEFLRLGPETVCAFVCETVVGAALGCVTPVRGYLRRMRQVCDRYGILLVLDEVMCGVGRTGTMHAWEQEEDVAPDIQTLGKGLGGGYLPIAAVLVAPKVVDALDKGTGSFVNGQTYGSHAVACAAALEVQRVIDDEGLLDNVRRMGVLLEQGLRARLGGHPHVGNIRGRGLFWGLEFVEDRKTKRPFDPARGVANGVAERGLVEGIALYAGTGTADGVRGDHVLLAPAYNVTEEVVGEIVELTGRAVEGFFEGLRGVGS